MKKKLNKIMMCLMIVLILSLSGCESETIEKDTTTDSININVEKPKLEQELEINGEDFKLKCNYTVKGYNISKWRVTDSKNIGMEVQTIGLPDGYEVYIDHVHADILLKSTSPQINGITQDTMDDTYHGLNQDGFWIDDNNSYYNIFSIEGYTDQFYQLWGYAFSDFGVVDSSYERLTEKNILRLGTYAEKLAVVYDISIKKPGNDKLYTKSVSSEILIPLSEN